MQIFNIHLHFFTSDMYFYSVSSEIFKILDNKKKKKLFFKCNLLLSFHYYEQVPFRFIYLFFSHITTPLVRLSLKGFSYTKFVLLWTQFSAWEWMRHLERTISTCCACVILKTAPKCLKNLFIWCQIYLQNLVSVPKRKG